VKVVHNSHFQNERGFLQWYVSESTV